jgi:16S rRNA (cytosine1402-N4)-methyltransferase
MDTVQSSSLKRQQSQKHIPVMVSEVMDFFSDIQDKVIVDATYGFGGHSQEFLKKGAYVIGIEKDPEIYAQALVFKERNNSSSLKLIYGDYRNLKKILGSVHTTSIYGAFFDLGVNSYHFDKAGRGFSYKDNSKLDMRFDKNADTMTARELIHSSTEKELAELISVYGEEPKAETYAKAIKKSKNMLTAPDLTEALKHAKADHKSISKVYQALRIAVNDELSGLKIGINQAIEMLTSKGKIAVISYHSLEDRIIKQAFRNNNLEELTDKPIRPSQKEIADNSRSRQAKLRIACQK